MCRTAAATASGARRAAASRSSATAASSLYALRSAPLSLDLHCKRAEMTADQFDLFALPKPALALVLAALGREDR